MRQILRCLVVLGFLILPTRVLAFGPHDALTCNGCHAPHTAKGEFIFAVDPNTKDVNSRTGQPNSGVTALCLGCHQDPANGGAGIKPIASHVSHPFGLTTVNQHVANVPPGLLENGRLECTACHDPHPSNPNFKYLRVDTSGGAKMDKFCVTCHGMKADADKGKGVEFFTSMDESKPREALLAVPAVRPAGETASSQGATPATPAAKHNKKPTPR